MESNKVAKSINPKIIVPLCVAVVLCIPIYFLTLEDEPDQMVDFNAKKQLKGTSSIAPQKRKTIRVPDPSYRQAPVFEDFQVIAKMYLHAMAPFKRQTSDWEAERLAFQVQRERINFVKDGAEVAENEAKISEFKYKSSLFSKKMKRGIPMQKSKEESGQVTTFNTESKSKASKSYSIRNLRLDFFTKGNRFAKTSASFSIGSEVFSNVEVNHVLATQFLVKDLIDSEFCATIVDLASRNQKVSKICRG